MKDPRLAALLSLLFTGMGQMYNGQMLKGALFSVIQLINISMIPIWVGIATTPIFALYAAYDAFRVADLLLPQDEKPAPGKSAPSKSTPSKSTPSKSTPSKSTPSKSTPSKSTRSKEKDG